MAELYITELLDKLKDPALAIAEAEAAYERRIAEVAERVVSDGSIRVLLLAGPSGSGKTTTANLISDKIKSLGERSMVVSLDDFYRSTTDPDYPKLKNGENDFESPDALDNAVLIKTLEDIIAGRDFSIPKYDFKCGRRAQPVGYKSFADGCVIVEGIHALNPRFSNPLPKESVLKLFVSVSTNINDNIGRILSGKKMRFVRRLVRDSIYRNAEASRTLSMWANVLKGENEYLYPYKETADLRFDTFHTFEVGVMKPFLDKLLTKDIVDTNPYARIVMDAMSRMPVIDERLVPNTSLIREFIPGGIYEDLY